MGTTVTSLGPIGGPTAVDSTTLGLTVVVITPDTNPTTTLYTEALP